MNPSLNTLYLKKKTSPLNGRLCEFQLNAPGQLKLTVGT